MRLLIKNWWEERGVWVLLIWNLLLTWAVGMLTWHEVME